MNKSALFVIFSLFVLILIQLQLTNCSFLNFLNRKKVTGKYQVDLNEIELDTIDLIEKYGFEGETHKIVTNDGYFLNLHRIVGSGTPVLLAHGLYGTSRDWIMPITGSSKDSLALLLAEENYDVWLFNSRGNYYSQGHQNKSINSLEFWDFSLDEQAMYDIPSAISYILNVGNWDKLNYIGFSMGNLLLYKTIAIKPEFNDKISVHIAYGSTVGYFGNSTSPIRAFNQLANPEEPIKSVANLLFYSHFPLQRAIRWAFKYICSNFRILCDFVTYFIVGYSPDKVIDDTHTVIFSRFPSRSSIRSLIQIMQGFDISEPKNPSKFYNYGPAGNLKKYGQFSPPNCDITLNQVPTFIFSGMTDALINQKDAQWTGPKNLIEHKIIDFEGSWAHTDFHWAQQAPELVYKPTLSILKDYN